MANDLFDHADKYPDHPGYSNQTTSKAAAESYKPVAKKVGEVVFNFIERKPMACFEIEQESGLTHQSVSARIRHLVLDGRVQDSGMKRVTPSGRKAIVWKVI